MKLVLDPGSLNPCARNPYWYPYLDAFSIPHALTDVNDHDYLYVVTMSFWDFNRAHMDYIPRSVLDRVRNGRARICFYYSEADPPADIRRHILIQCDRLDIDPSRVKLISANSAADRVPGCHYFFDDFAWYWYLMRDQSISIADDQPRSDLFTCLVRTHKQWRSDFVWNLLHTGVCDTGKISYHGISNMDDRDDAAIINPEFLRWQSQGLCMPPATWWLDRPLRVDGLNGDDANNHSIVIKEHYQSYVNVILETYLDLGPSAVFVTEKTMKAICHGQMFMVVGCPGTLDFLRQQGFETFQTGLDESYDHETDVRLRWYQVFDQLRNLAGQHPDTWHRIWSDSLDRIQHNQRVFRQGPGHLVRQLWKNI